MKRLFPTSLALLLVMGSLGHVFAAAFCHRVPGHDCCLKKTASVPHGTQSHQHMQGMAMDAVANESTRMNGSDRRGMMVDDGSVPPSPLAVNDLTLLSTPEESIPGNKLELPLDVCTHCLSHSGTQSAPVSSVSVSDRSNKDLGSVSLPVSRFLAKSAMTLAQIGLSRQHAPPCNCAPRHILLSVFLI